MDPHKLILSDLLGNATVSCTLKHTDNKEGCAIVNLDKDIRDIDHAKQILKSINPDLLKAVSDEKLQAFANFTKKNVAKRCYVSQYYHGDNFVLIGDAAHPFRPIGQGINIAMMDGVWLDQYLKTYPHDVAKALRNFGSYSKLQGDACLNISPLMKNKPLLLREFINYGLGI